MKSALVRQPLPDFEDGFVLSFIALVPFVVSVFVSNDLKLRVWAGENTSIA